MCSSATLYVLIVRVIDDLRALCPSCAIEMRAQRVVLGLNTVSLLDMRLAVVNTHYHYSTVAVDFIRRPTLFCSCRDLGVVGMAFHSLLS